jgi:hypothetical protein
MTQQQELIENPETLLALVRQSVQYLIEQRPDTAEQEAQLRAIAKAIEQLEKQQIPVPDALRRTKMNLVAEIGQQDQFAQQLKMLSDGLADAQKMIDDTFGQPTTREKSGKSVNPRSRVSRPPRTSNSELKKYILQSLTELGGRAHCSEVLNQMQKLLEGRLLPGDLDPHKSCGLYWRYYAHWAYQLLIHEGTACRTSQRGYWELNPDIIKQ